MFLIIAIFYGLNVLSTEGFATFKSEMGKSWSEFWGQGFDFTGRTTRREFLLACLSVLVRLLVIGCGVIILLALMANGDGGGFLGAIGGILGIIGSMLFIALIVPTLAIFVRRYRDVGVSIWVFILIIILSAFTSALLSAFTSSGVIKLVVGLIGEIINLVICLSPSKKVENDLQNIPQNVLQNGE
ncbi:hypothetical protein CCY99_00565 [Helicobacter sp. 16-1353]|uniref:DUF805 domain-containing protein n=1 Tax=Helicobacter sp. 16-1353 TaxID=2004996 RepID=UPI000DCD3579|nr:DUF805 domain-containing protein [Helicobacter sp. 16-1353]RAX55225.1 hypothetical protein CCY99_00565 [Helicobacter sp. 16-1353]